MIDTKQPLISIIIPYYNCARYIEETLQSIEQQSYRNFEVILVNDGSHESDTKILENIIQEKSYIQYVYQNNKGVANARNTGGRLAKGKFLLFLDADDLLHQEYLQKTIEVLQSTPNCKLVYTKAQFFEAQTGDWRLSPYLGLKSILQSNMIYITALHRHVDFEDLNGFDEDLQTHEDWDYWIRLLQDGGHAICLDEILFFYRKRHDKDSLTDGLIANPDDNRRDWQKIYLKHSDLYVKNELSYFDLIQTIQRKPKKKYFNWLKRFFNQ